MTRLMDGNNDANTRRATDGHGWRPCIMCVVLAICGVPPSGNAPVDLWVSKMAIQECRLHSQPVQWDRESTNQAETARCMSHDFGQSCNLVSNDAPTNRSVELQHLAGIQHQHLVNRGVGNLGRRLVCMFGCTSATLS